MRDSIRAALIQLGWTPPPDAPAGTEWVELLRPRDVRARTWYLLDQTTDEIVAWINKHSDASATYIYNGRYFVSLTGAKRAAEQDFRQLFKVTTGVTTGVPNIPNCI